MKSKAKSRLPELIETHEAALLDEWIGEQPTAVPRQKKLMKEAELREQCSEVIRALRDGSAAGEFERIDTEEWAPMRELLASISRSRSTQGFSPSETALFVFSLKRPILTRLRKELGKDPQTLVDEMSAANELLDRLGLFTTEVAQKSRDDIISRQQQDMLELSTPVVKLWEGILALPLIGTLDSARTQVVMESLLQKIVETGSEVAIIDITGVPTVDTLVAQHLLKTVTSARLMGADCIISGIRPQIAQTIVHLGVELGDVITKSSLADAFVLALRRSGRTIANTGQSTKRH